MPNDSVTPSTVESLAKSLGSNFSKAALKQLLVRQLAGDKPGLEVAELEAEDLTRLVVRLEETAPQKATVDEAALSAGRSVTEQFTTILERERLRLAPLAAREHWVALGFAVVAGAVFFQSIVLAVIGSPLQAVITLIASLIPGFISQVFFSREAVVEQRLKEISADLRTSERMRERLALLTEALSIVPEDSKATLVERYMRKSF